MQPKLTRYFTDSAAALLAAVAAALFICNLANTGLVQPRDPLLQISTRTVFWIMGASDLLVALVCIFARQSQLKLTLIIVLTLNLMVYRLGLLGKAHDLRGYLDALADTFGLSTGPTETILKAMFLYLLIGGFVLLVWPWLQRTRTRAGERGYFKMSCIHCGGHVAFPVKALGQTIACPHCADTITLQKPD